jgi:hypothetical protein
MNTLVTGSRRAGKQAIHKANLVDWLIENARENGEASMTYFLKDGHAYEFVCTQLPKKEEE